MFWPWFFLGGYCNNLMSLDCFVNRELLSIPSLLHRSKLWSYFPTLTQVDKWTCGPIQPKLRGFMALLCHRAMMDWYGLWWIRLTNQIFITQFIKYALACFGRNCCWVPHPFPTADPWLRKVGHPLRPERKLLYTIFKVVFFASILQVFVHHSNINSIYYIISFMYVYILALYIYIHTHIISPLLLTSI